MNGVGDHPKRIELVWQDGCAKWFLGGVELVPVDKRDAAIKNVAAAQREACARHLRAWYDAATDGEYDRVERWDVVAATPLVTDSKSPPAMAGGDSKEPERKAVCRHGIPRAEAPPHPEEPAAEAIDEDEDHVCKRCHSAYNLRDGGEPSGYCDPCAHDVISELNTEIAEANARTAKVEARCEELRKAHLEQWSFQGDDVLHFGCQLCGREFSSPTAEEHNPGCLAVPARSAFRDARGTTTAREGR